jgi:hypothetical protein
MAASNILIAPIAVGLLMAFLLPFTGYKWDGKFVRPVAAAAIGLAIAQFALGLVVDDPAEMGPGSARWIGNVGAITILLANGVSLIITRRALKRSGRGLPYRF